MCIAGYFLNFSFKQQCSLSPKCASLLTESPADEAGVTPNDTIIGIDGQNVSMLAADMVAKIIRYVYAQ